MAMMGSLLVAGGSVGQERPAAISEGVVTGRVLGPLGEPVPACRVEFLEFLDGAWSDVVRGEQLTDAEGFFVQRLPVDAGSLLARVRMPGRTLALGLVHVTAARPRSHLDLRLWEARDVRGRVVDPEGRPVAGCEVIAVCDAARSLPRPMAEATTADDGCFTLESVALGPATVRAWSREHGFGECRIEAGEDTAPVIRPTREGGVGMVLGVVGLPREVVAVLDVSANEGRRPRSMPRALTRAEVRVGHNWQRDCLPDLSYTVRPFAAGYVFEPPEAQRAAGHAPHVAAFRARRIGADSDAAAGQVSGRLVDDRGEPLAGEMLVCRAREGSGGETTARTDAEGRFAMPAPAADGVRCVLFLRDSQHVVRQEKRDGHLGSWDARFLRTHEFRLGSSDPLVVHAAPGARVEGRVVDEDGRPRPWTRVDLESSAENRSPRWASFQDTLTDREGRFVFRTVHPTGDPLRVAVGQGPTEAGVSEALSLTAFGERVTGLVVRVPATGSVAGRVVDGDGVGRPGARLWLRSGPRTVAGHRERSSSLVEAFTDRDGRFVFVEVPPGPHIVQVFGLDEAAVVESETLDVPPGKRIECTLEWK